MVRLPGPQRKFSIGQSRHVLLDFFPFFLDMSVILTFQGALVLDPAVQKGSESRTQKKLREDSRCTWIVIFWLYICYTYTIYTAIYIRPKMNTQVIVLHGGEKKWPGNLSTSIPGFSQPFSTLAFQTLIKLGKYRQFCVIFHFHPKIAFRK